MTAAAPIPRRRSEKPVHTALAFIIVVLFAASGFAPYFVKIPEGQGGNLIVGFAEALKNIAILVVGYYFGSTATNAKRNEMLTEAALSPQPPPAPGTARIEAAADVRADLQVTDAPPAGERLP